MNENVNIGKRIRKMRLQRGLTIRQLAEFSGYSIGFISNIERNNASPTITCLQNICAAFGTTVHDFFSLIQDDACVSYKNKREKIHIPNTHGAYAEVCFMQNTNLSVTINTLEPGSDYLKTLVSNKSDEICYILSGKLRLQVNDKVHDLCEGDCIYIDSFAKHDFQNVSDTVCTCLWVQQRIYE